MKILMCAPFDTNGRYRGGITEMAVGICTQEEELSRLGLRIERFETCRIRRDAASEGRLRLSNIRNFLAARRALYREIRQGDHEVVYYHTSMRMGLLKDLLILQHARRARRIRTVVHIHYGEAEKILPHNRFLRAWTLRLLRKAADSILLLSKRTKEELATYGVPEKRMEVLYNFNQLRYSEQEMADKLLRMRRGEPLRLLFVGSLSERKGVRDLLSAMRACRYPYSLELCGVPTDAGMEVLCRDAEEQSGGKVYLSGYVRGSDKKDAYSRADVLVLPSYEEGLPVVILEAYAAGCAVIAGRVGAIPEIVAPENGVLITPGDRAALAAAIHAYASDRERLAATAACNHRAAAVYTPAHFLSELSGIFYKKEEPAE